MRSSLNHPNIAAIYDVQEAGETRFLALELVEGECLADQLSRGPIPVDESLTIARQISEAPQAAHEKVDPENQPIQHWPRFYPCLSLASRKLRPD